MTDLTDCDREPIHIPGSIQPHGVLVVVEEPDLRVTQASENLAALLGVPVEEALGRPLAAVLGRDAAALVGAVLAHGRFDEVNPLPLHVGGRAFDGVLHRHLGAAILELEPILGEPEPGAVGRPRPVMARLQLARDLREMAATLAEEVRRLTGFDRALVYRFDEDDHGEVVAESRDERFESYLGLHYPASDIPKQARALYLANWLRIIPDAAYVPARIVPAQRPGGGGPLDLTHAVLRSVSPVHVEYLHNMGVTASMSISLVVGGRLWGLVTCGHHSGPRYVPFETRATCEAIGRLASVQIAALEELGARDAREARAPPLRTLVEAMQRSEASIFEGLSTRPAELLALVGAEGAALCFEGQRRTIGACPPDDALDRIAAWLTGVETGGLHETSALARALPEAAAWQSTASGLLSISLPGLPARRVVWFLPERVRAVSWAGDPRKPLVPGATDARLHPRRSFEHWKEEVRGTSRRWSPYEIEAAAELRRSAVEVDLARQVTSARQAVRVRDDLVAVVSHDLRNPLSVIQLQAQILATTDQDPPTVHEAAERIRRATDHMSGLIRDLLDLARIEAGRFTVQPRPVDVPALLAESVQLLRTLAESRRIALRVESEPGLRVQADRDRIYQVLSNLVGNALKFTPEGGAIRVSARAVEREVCICVADTGPGVPEDQRAHIFERYWQAGRTVQGAGLGLYIARGIVEAHGGRIWVETEPGWGAVFRFTLPAA